YTTLFRSYERLVEAFYGKYGRLRPPDNALCRTAHQKVLEACEAVRGHHDHPGAVLLRKPDDLTTRSPRTGFERRLNHRARRCLEHSPHLSYGLFLDIRLDVIDGLHRNPIERRMQCLLHDMKEIQLRIVE